MKMAATEINVATVLDNERLRWPHILIWGICFLSNLLDGFDAQLMAFASPAITKQWHLPPTAFAAVFVAATAGIAIGNFISGPIADRFGRKNVIVATTVMYALATLAVPYCESLGEIAILRLVAGIGLGAVIPNTFAITSEYAPARYRATLIGTMFVGGPLGGVLAGFLSAYVISTFGWQAVFTMGGILPMILLPFVAFFMPESVRFLVARGADRKVVAGHLNRMAGERKYYGAEIFILPAQPKKAFFVKQLFSEGRAVSTSLVTATYIANMVVLFFLANWLPLALKDAKVSPENLLRISSLFYLGGVLGGIVLARIVDLYGTYRTLIPTFIITIFLSASIGYTTEHVWAMVAAIFLSGFCVIGGQTAVHPITASIYPTSIRSSGMSWALGVGRIGSIIGSSAGGILLGLDLGSRNIFLLLAIPTTITVVALAALSKVRHGVEDAI